MPVEKLKLQAGVDVQATPTLNQAKFSFSQLIRFYDGLVQKLGGWQRFCPTPVIGTCRSLLGWADLKGNAYVATGTEQRLQVIVAGVTEDITPIVATTNAAVSFSTVNNSAAVTINDTYTPSVGDWINLVAPVSVGGLILSGYCQIVTVGIGYYTFTAPSLATSTVTNGGAVPAFATTITSATVTVTFNNHGYVAGQSVFNVPIRTTVGGIALSGIYAVVTVLDANTFTITGATLATSTATGSMNGGEMQIQYLLPSGNANNAVIGGYGTGIYGEGNYGAANSSGLVSPARIWALDHFGQDLVASPLNGLIYYWSPVSGGQAAVVSNTAPLYNKWIFVAAQVEILMALGSSDNTGTQYPLLARWCDAGDFTDWTPSVSNQAGSFQLFSGSTLMFGAANGLTLFLWTDFGIWSVTYQGQPYIFSFQELSRECGAISSRSVAVGTIGAVWLSAQGFFQLGANGVQPMECPVWDWYFNNVDTTQLSAITSALNTEFHEVSWYFPVVGGGMYYIKWNWTEPASPWDIGILTRTAWIDASPAGQAMGVDANGLVQQHEIAADADGATMLPSVTTGYFDVQEGDDFIFVDMIQPDFVCSPGAQIALTVLSRDYAGGPTKTDGPYLVQPNTVGGTSPASFVTCNSRGRQVALTISSSDIGSSWRLGAIRYRFRPDGRL